MGEDVGSVPPRKDANLEAVPGSVAALASVLVRANAADRARGVAPRRAALDPAVVPLPRAALDPAVVPLPKAERPEDPNPNAGHRGNVRRARKNARPILF